MCTIRDLYAFAAPPRLARRVLVDHQLRVVPGVIQDLEFGNGRRQHLHVLAGGSDDHDGRRTGGHLHTVDPGRVGRAPLMRRISSPGITRTSFDRVKCCGSIDIPARALRKRHTHRRFTLTKLGRSTIFMIGTQTPGTDRPAAHHHRGHDVPGPAPLRHACRTPRPCSSASTRSPTRCGSTTRTAPRTTAATWRSISPRKSAPNSAQETSA